MVVNNDQKINIHTTSVIKTVDYCLNNELSMRQMESALKQIKMQMEEIQRYVGVGVLDESTCSVSSTLALSSSSKLKKAS